MTQKPTPGRIVFYFPSEQDKTTVLLSSNDKVPAIIISTTDTICTLYIFSAGMESPVRWSIPYKEDAAEGYSYWAWPEIAPVLHITRSEGYKPTTDGESGDMTYRQFTEENQTRA